MSCSAPFKNPRSNALAYLKTKNAIDNNLRIQKGFQTFADRLQRSALSYGVTDPLFIVNDGAISINEIAFEKIDQFRGELPEVEEEVFFEEVGIRSQYKEEEIRKVSAEVNRSQPELPDWLGEEDRIVLEQLVKRGHVELNCI